MIRIHGYPMSILGPWFLAWEALTVEGGQQCHCGSGGLGTSWDLWLCLKLAPYTPAEIATLVWENVGKWGWSILGVPGKGIQLEFTVYSSWLPKKSRLCNWSRYLKFLPPVGAKALAPTALWSLNTAEDMFASSCWGKKSGIPNIVDVLAHWDMICKWTSITTNYFGVKTRGIPGYWLCDNIILILTVTYNRYILPISTWSTYACASSQYFPALHSPN